MSILNPISSTKRLIPSATTPATGSGERQVDLRLQQMVQATVVEGGPDRALLEINHRQYRAQSDIELQTGQKLTLQVLQTRPELEFRIINDPFGGRLSQLLPLLTRPYDWSRLLDVLRQQPEQRGLPQTTDQVYQQLQQLLQPGEPLPAAIERLLQILPAQVQQLSLSGGAAPVAAGPPIPVVQGESAAGVTPAATAAQPSLPQLVRGLQGQLSQLQTAIGRPLPSGWLAETSNLLAPLQQNVPGAQIPQSQVNALLTVLGELRQQPNLPKLVTGELERLLLQLKLLEARQFSPAGKTAGRNPVLQPPAAAVMTATGPSATDGSISASTPQNRSAQPSVLSGAAIGSPSAVQAAPVPSLTQTLQATAVPPTGFAAQPAGVYRSPAAAAAVPVAQALPVPPETVGAGLEKLLAQLQPGRGQAIQFTPELLGRLEGLLDKLHQLPPVDRSGQTALPGLELITGQLSQLVQQGVVLQPKGGALGILSQLFGFHLEAELLNGKKQEALASLKMSLLTLRKKLGDKVAEPLRRLELFQLSKVRLAEEQVQFLPLPFNELEEGYLLMEKRRRRDDTAAAADPPLQLSLALRLSALGNMRVDMLYDKQGLHLRVACEDNAKMTYLQEHSTELKESIATVPLHGVSFSADARQPARELSARLLPDALSMLDSRI